MALIDNIRYAFKLDDDAANTTVADEIATDHGILTGGDNTADISESGKLTNCLRYDGSNDYVDVGAYDSNMSATSAFSVSFWINTDSVTGNHIIWSNSDGGNNRVAVYTNGNEVGIAIYDTGSWHGTGGESGVAHTTTISTTTWYHVVITYDGSGTPKVYLDDDATNGGISQRNAGTSSHIIAAMNDGSIVEHFDGLIDDLYIWTREITGAEVTSLYNSGSGFAYPFATGTDFQINIGDAWKAVPAMQINIGDAWKEVDGAQINIGDAWKSLF